MKNAGSLPLTALSGTLSVNQALSGFGNSTIWLIVIAFFFSRGLIRTGLGSRITYLFMAALGKKTLGLGYGLIATDLVLAPAIPGNTARADGIVFPWSDRRPRHSAVNPTMAPRARSGRSSASVSGTTAAIDRNLISRRLANLVALPLRGSAAKTFGPNSGPRLTRVAPTRV